MHVERDGRDFTWICKAFELEPGNKTVAAVLWGLGRIYGKRSEYDRALSCFSDCYAIRKSRLGEDHEDTMAVKRFLDAIERKRRRNAT